MFILGLALDSTLSNLANYIYCDTSLPVDISDVFYGFLLPPNFDDKLLSEMNKALSVINRSKRFQDRYQEYMEKYYGNLKCATHIAGQDDYIE